MENFYLLLSAAMPEELILDMLEEKLKEYKESKNPDHLGKIEMICGLLLSKRAIKIEGGGFEGTQNVIEKMDRMKRGHDLLDPKKN